MYENFIKPLTPFALDREVQVIMNPFYECVNGWMNNNQVSQIKGLMIKKEKELWTIKKWTKRMNGVWRIDHLPHEFFQI